MFQKVTKSILSHGQALKAFSVSFLLEFKLFFLNQGYENILFVSFSQQ